MAKSKLTPVSGILARVIRQYGLEGKFREHQLLQEWSGIVGETIARHTRPEEIRFKKLHLVVDSSAWMQQLTFFKKEIIDKVNAAFKSEMVREIRMKVGPIGER
ncbi:MAG: DUF721 domain-containing protein [Nitrospirae bacterium]|nr:DUF721 domain-containing protein [Nitrospirota bacterium]